MRKTSVYLTDEEAEGLYRAAAASGRSQAQLLREGVRWIIGEWDARPRTFHSMGAGRGGGEPYVGWDPDELHRRVMGER